MPGCAWSEVPGRAQSDAAHDLRHARLAAMSTAPDRLALHTCCAPCLIEPLRILSKRFGQVAVVYYNPNITPAKEYERRRDTAAAYAEQTEVPFHELDDEPPMFEEEMDRHLLGLRLQGLRGDPETPQRCERCYRLRFSRVISWATDQGFTHFATTLTVSPYQQQEVIDRVARELCADAGLVYAGCDFSDRYQEATRIARQMGLYRQNYCGCTPRVNR